uniref:Uncharacterized protein AlNc14C272G9974 n=2 Tax=Albugo laibachii Nc14 TaxID=890382 RepID=F0WUF4_9STRA|nr:conserved hypothetical protein [Albugo laibachii Nc14]|eukprot:CCA25034.1 conserved hypothetical protein [Albugo laibachii Nc14]
MEVRHRVQSSASTSDAHYQQPSISFWICFGKNKNRVESSSTTSTCLQVLEEAKVFTEVVSKLASGDNDLHLMNESSGAVVAINRSMESQISDGDVITICSSSELEKLLEKFTQYNPKANHQRSPSSIGTLAISKLKRIKHTNSTLKALQKSFENHFNQEDTRISETYSEVGPIFDTQEIEQEDPLAKGGSSHTEKHAVSTKSCDVCDVSWPDAPGHYMYRFKSNSILTHHGCAQFAADIQKHYPETTLSRRNFIDMTQASQVNKPGTFFITAERAIDLPGLQILGSHAPYTKLSLLPWKEPQQTKPTEVGGRNPIWKKMHENKMQLTHMYNSSITPIPLMEVEIWNSNYIADDLMACALLDMSPLLRYPNVEIRRWFMLSSRGAAAALTRSFRSNSPRIFLSILFSPEESALPPSMKHKFRVHQLRSIGIVMPICDRVIVNVLKGAWGYRCENCQADVHKGCLIKAAAKLPCRGPCAGSNEQESRDKEESSWNLTEHFCWRNALKFRILNDHEAPPSAIQSPSHNSCVGYLYVDLYSLHVCTKQCQPDVDFHIKNIYEGDTYCRLSFEDTLHETNPVLKTADPVFQERVCWKVRHRDAILQVQAIDFNTDASFGEMSIDLFKLLQRKADKLMYEKFNGTVSSMLDRRRRRVSSCDRKSDDLNASAPVSLHSYGSIVGDLERFDLKISSKALSTTPSSKKRIAGFLMAKFEYVESTRDLFRFRLPEETQLLEREEKECNVESLKATFDRFGRILRIFKWLDVEYARLISWKDKPRSALWFGLFVLLCVKVDLEYFGAYVFYGLIVLQLYQLRFRLSHAYLDRWIGHLEYENDQIDNLKMHRPLAALYVAVHEAQLTPRTEKAISEALYMLSRDSSAKRRLYVRIKYLPNDRAPYTGTVFIPSDFKEVLIGWTHAIEMSSSPVWRTTFIPPHLTTSTNPFASAFASKTRNESPFRNLNVSWRHDPQECNCSRCLTYLDYKRKHAENPAGETPPTCGVDSHAFFFPVPQCRKKDSTGHASLVQWKSSPGLLQFELCLSSTGDIKEAPEFIVAIGSIPLGYVATTSDRMNEMNIPLNLLQQFEDKSPHESDSSPPLSTLKIRVKLCELEARPHTFDIKHSSERRSSVSLDPSMEPSSSDDSSNREISMEKSTTTIHTRAKRAYSDYVCSALAQKDKFSHAVLGGQLFDTFYKMMDTMKTVQNEVGRACGTVACVENVFNWTHPWKTAVVCLIFLAAAIIFSVIPGRWIVLLFGCSEFGAALLKDHPPSNRFRNMLWNFLSSIPTDEDLIRVYSDQREAYDQSREREKQQEEVDLMLLRHHALWLGSVYSKSDHERHYKKFFLVYRSFRLLFWKSEEDANNGSAATVQFLIDCEAPNNFKVIEYEQSMGFTVSGTTHHEVREKRSLVSNALEMNKLLDIIQRDCAFI